MTSTGFVFCPETSTQSPNPGTLGLNPVFTRNLVSTSDSLKRLLGGRQSAAILAISRGAVPF